ncbi:hypothetical protein F895_02784 [Acinetobacter sp. CIP 64.2]|uniref:hypothetical protein n=1 Tax=unclassified Acinetobacter TaxID=196816 RepID=UPI00028927D1|nr:MULTISPECIES: hypothetical protein [unclassified Acinetobacter]ENX13056.1 hypothetical protein F895_02784 [Acinetobacter sp. CIP 64.2]
MTQERTTSLRILQTNKKKTLSPVIYLLIGFLSGIIFTSLIFFLFVTDSNTAEAVPLEQEQTVDENTNIQPHAKVPSHSSEEPMPVHHETAESAEDNGFAQPGSNDLNKFFQRTPPPTAPVRTGQQISPFANEPNSKAVQPSAPAKPIATKNELPTTNKVVKPASQPVKAASPKTVEPEAEAPDATVQIKVTQKPFAVNELK